MGFSPTFLHHYPTSGIFRLLTKAKYQVTVWYRRSLTGVLRKGRTRTLTKGKNDSGLPVCKQPAEVGESGNDVVCVACYYASVRERRHGNEQGQADNLVTNKQGTYVRCCWASRTIEREAT